MYGAKSVHPVTRARLLDQAADHLEQAIPALQEAGSHLWAEEVSEMVATFRSRSDRLEREAMAAIERDEPTREPANFVRLRPDLRLVSIFAEHGESDPPGAA